MTILGAILISFLASAVVGNVKQGQKIEELEKDKQEQVKRSSNGQ